MHKANKGLYILITKVRIGSPTDPSSFDCSKKIQPNYFYSKGYKIFYPYRPIPSSCNWRNLQYVKGRSTFYFYILYYYFVRARYNTRQQDLFHVLAAYSMYNTEVSVHCTLYTVQQLFHVLAAYSMYNTEVSVQYARYNNSSMYWLCTACTTQVSVQCTMYKNNSSIMY